MDCWIPPPFFFSLLHTSFHREAPDASLGLQWHFAFCITWGFDWIYAVQKTNKQKNLSFELVFPRLAARSRRRETQAYSLSYKLHSCLAVCSNKLLTFSFLYLLALKEQFTRNLKRTLKLFSSFTPCRWYRWSFSVCLYISGALHQSCVYAFLWKTDNLFFFFQCGDDCFKKLTWHNLNIQGNIFIILILLRLQ